MLLQTPAAGYFYPNEKTRKSRAFFCVLLFYFHYTMYKQGIFKENKKNLPLF